MRMISGFTILKLVVMNLVVIRFRNLFYLKEIVRPQIQILPFLKTAFLINIQNDIRHGLYREK